MVLAADLLQIPSRTLLPWGRCAQPSVQLCQHLQVLAVFKQALLRQPQQRRPSLTRLLLEPTHTLDVTLREPTFGLCHRLPFTTTLVSEISQIPYDFFFFGF